MAKRLGKTESYKVKELIFVLIVIVIIIALVALVFFREQVQLWIIAGALAIVVFFLISRYDFLLTLKEYERAVIFRFGKARRVGGPGWTFIIPVIESARIVDLRTQTIDTPHQDVITKDRVVVKIDAIIYLYVKKDKQSVMNSVIEIRDYRKGAEQFVIASIRDAAGELTLPELISNIDKLNDDVKKNLQSITEEWGVFIDAVEIKDITLPKELSDAYAAQKAAEQQKLARMETAKAHQAEIDAVRKAAEQLSDKAVSYYYIKALEELGKSPSTKYFFPIELAQLASKVSGTKSEPALERLFKEYEPQIRKYLKTARRAPPARSRTRTAGQRAKRTRRRRR